MRVAHRGVSILLEQHYNKVIAFCCFLFMAVNIGFTSTALNVYQTYIVELPGMNHSLGGMIPTIRALTSLLATFFVSFYYRRLDCRAGVVLGTSLTALGFVVYALHPSFPTLAVGSVFTGLGYGLGGAVATTLLVGRWFTHDVGKAAGFAAMGSGVAGAVIPVMAVAIINSYGLQASFAAEAVLAALVALTIGLLLRNRPAGYGAARIGASGVPSAQETSGGESSDNAQQEIDSAQLAEEQKPYLTARDHNLLMIAMLGVGCACTGGVSYLAILMTSNGIDPVLAATFVALQGITLSLGKFCAGAVMDKIGSRRGALLFFGIFIVALLCCSAAFTGSPVVCAVGAALFGLGASLGSTGISVWSLEFSHRDDRARITKDFQAAYAMGGLVTNLLPGLLMTATGTYCVSYLFMAVMVTLSLIIILRVYKHRAQCTAKHSSHLLF